MSLKCRSFEMLRNVDQIIRKRASHRWLLAIERCYVKTRDVSRLLKLVNASLEPRLLTSFKLKLNLNFLNPFVMVHPLDSIHYLNKLNVLYYNSSSFGPPITIIITIIIMKNQKESYFDSLWQSRWDFLFGSSPNQP